MSMDVVLHKAIEDYNVLTTPTKKISEYFRNNPGLYKVALLTNHIFRAVAMTAFCLTLPFSAPVNFAVCFAGSLFYRLTVETNCAYKFALPAFAGAVALPVALTGLTALVSGAAFISLGALAATFVSFIPLAAYTTYIVLTVNYDVDSRAGGRR